MLPRPNLILTSRWPFRQSMSRRASTLQMMVVMLIGVGVSLTGCQEREIKTGYGRAYGDNYSRSVNGTAVLHEMVEASGHEVDRYRKYSPRWDRYETVFWIPDSFSPPSKEVIGKIENWLANGNQRTLVYVARDFDAAEIYWDRLRNKEADEQVKEDLSRQYFDSSTRHMLARSRVAADARNCDWFKSVTHPYTLAEEFSGTLLADIDEPDFDIRYRSLLSPGDDLKSGEFGDYAIEELMSVDEKPFIYALKKSRFSGGRIIVVGNSSFLLNLPLANAANRELADELLFYALQNDYFGNEILFIESGGELPISDKDSPDHQSQWSWITKKPLRYIVPNILFCCLLFCFVYFPIFGRPRNVKRQSTTNFRDHIDALAQLIRKTKSRTEPRAWIEEYRRRAGHSRSRQDNITSPSSSSKNENE